MNNAFIINSDRALESRCLWLVATEQMNEGLLPGLRERASCAERPVKPMIAPLIAFRDKVLHELAAAAHGDPVLEQQHGDGGVG